MEDPEFGDTTFDGDDLFAIFESLENVTDFPPPTTSFDHEAAAFGSKEGEETASGQQESSEMEPETSSPKRKRARFNVAGAASCLEDAGTPNGQQRVSHITVERNRRKQMNGHLTGDQASIIGGVVNYINELQQILQSLEAKKQRKVYNEVLSPRLMVSSPRLLSPLSPRKPLLSPRLNLPISPRTPQPSSPFIPRTMQKGYNSSLGSSPTSSSSSSININDSVNELVANSKSPVADVEVKFSGSNLLLKTVSPKIPGQAVKIIAALEDLSLEILDVSITTKDETLHNSFTIKIGIDCRLSADELAQQIQRTFCSIY